MVAIRDLVRQLRALKLYHEDSQRLHYPLIKEYSLNRIRDLSNLSIRILESLGNHCLRSVLCLARGPEEKELWPGKCQGFRV